MDVHIEKQQMFEVAKMIAAFFVIDMNNDPMTL